ncbi:MAG: hypothetical protein ACXACU_06460 [Candidatus Hodarchaeales archaeon]|jgi:hypothetical protein
MELHESIKQARSRLEDDYDIEEWLTLAHFPDDTRVNLTPRGRRFIFQKGIVLESLESVVSRAQWSRYRSNPEMSIPVSTIRLLITNKPELFMTSFTVTTIGNKKIQLPIKLPIKTRNNSITKLLAILTLSKNVFITGTFQTDRKAKVDALLETFDSIFDVNLCPDGKIALNQRGYYIKIPVQICTALVKAFTGEDKASFPSIISSVAKCKDEQDILEFVTTWLRFSRVYRFNDNQENLFMFRYNDETRELVKLLDIIGVQYETGSIIDSGSFVPVYRIPNIADNTEILGTHSIMSRLKGKIQNQEARIKELETIKDDLEDKLKSATQSIHEKLAWSKGMDERLVDDLKEKIIEFERILLQTKHENERWKQILRNSGTLMTDESILLETNTEPTVANDINQLREEVELLKERLALMNQPSPPSKELSYKVTQEISLKADTQPSFTMDLDLRPLVKTFLANPDNWVLFILGSNESLTMEQIRKILGISVEKRMDSDLIGSYTTTLLGNKELVPLELRQLVRNVLR